MRKSFIRRTATDIDKVFFRYGGLAGGHPEQRDGDAAEPYKQVVERLERNRRGNYLGKAPGGVNGILEAARRKTDQIARQSEIEDLSLAVGEDLVTADEAAAQNEDVAIRTALGDDVAVAPEPPFPPMEVAKEPNFSRRKRQAGGQLVN